MCPDQQLISVFMDGELPSPWKEKMETHLAQCPSCKKSLENYRQLFAPVKETVFDEKALMEAAKDRVWQNMAQSLQSRRQHRAKPRSFAGMLRHRVSVSMPAVAAAAAVFVIMASFLVGGRFTSQPAAVQVAAPTMAEMQMPMLPAMAAMPGVMPMPTMSNTILSSEEALPNVLPAMDMSGVLQYLGGLGTGEIIILRLPENRSFISSGEPTMIKAADDYRRR